MTATLNQGPYIAAGNVLDASPTGVQKSSPDAGPNISYKGRGFLDVRYYPINKERIGIPGSIPAFRETPSVQVLNYVPSAPSTAGIAAAQNVTNGTAMTLAAASAGIATGIPFLQFGTNTIVTANIALDFGFDSANCTSGSATVTVADSSIYVVGQPIVIANVGNSGGTSALLTYVTSLASATTITVANAPLATNSATPIGSGSPGWANLVGSGPIIPQVASPYLESGVGLFFNPNEGVMRGISITGVSGGAGGAFLVTGYDIYGQLQTQTITVAAGANTVNSTKTWKYIQSIVPQFTDAHNYSVNTIDLYGFPLFNKYWEELEIYYNGALVTSSTGWTAGVTTAASSTTGDPRGTYALQSAANASKRLVIFQSPSFYEICRAGPDSPQKLYGVTPA